jgi:uncharacterized protein YecA (UPF0149 family)
MKVNKMEERRKVTLVSPEEGYAGLTVQKTGRNDLCRCGSGKRQRNVAGQRRDTATGKKFTPV